MRILGTGEHYVTFDLKAQLPDIPTLPGVYLYKDADGRIIYVGKAKHLRKRLASYARDDAAHTPKTRAMLKLAVRVDTLCTDTEKEALLLEASLIKKHRPRYNIVLRDDKQYVLFKLERRSEFPRLILTRRVVRDGSLYYGPFTSAQAAREAWKAIHQLFPLRRCTDRTLNNRVRPCLYHHIGLCLAPCVLDVDRTQYATMVKRVELLLSGRGGELLGSLKKEMLDASEALEFEKAAVLRDRIRAVEQTIEKQTTVLHTAEDMDVLGLARTEDGLALGLLFIRQGRLLDRKNFFWPKLALEDGREVLEGFLSQYYNPQRFIPDKILLPWDLEAECTTNQESSDITAAKDPEETNNTLAQDCNETSAGDLPFMEAFALVLAERRGSAVKIHPPRSGTEKQLVAMAETNARESAAVGKAAPLRTMLTSLAAKLHLPPLDENKPFRIESVDVSHTSGQETRAGMVVFEDGEARKDQYRVYKFDDEGLTNDDYGVMRSWTRRRIKSGPPWPDLLLIDGGKGQLAMIEKTLEDEGQPGLWNLAAIAKTRSLSARDGIRRKAHALDDRIFLPGRKNPMPIKEGSPELLFLQHVRDTVHNFVIGRHRRSHRKSALSGELLSLPGVGQKTARLLWDRFPSLDAMLEASPESLMRLPGFGKKKAETLYATLQQLRQNKNNSETQDAASTETRESGDRP